ncbi:putative replication protein [Escherichia coli]|nr:putative replication protein [Escherichia coli]
MPAMTTDCQGKKFLRELCEVDLLVLDEIGIQRETKKRAGGTAPDC